MAVTGPTDFSPSMIKNLSMDKYISLGAYINEINKPDNRDALVKTFGEQGITGFLQLVGATKAQAVADEVTYWEETRLHAKQTGSFSADDTFSAASAAAVIVRVNDVVLVGGETRAFVSAVSGADITLVALDGSTLASALTDTALPVIGNLYAQGTEQPGGGFESNVVKRTNPFMIMKEAYKVSGSQATNIGWVNLGNGDYRWFMKGEMDTRQRFMDKRELMMLLGQKVTATAGISSASISGSEGYFEAVQNRGLVAGGRITDFAGLDDVVKELDRQGAGPEYAMYVDRGQDLAIDDMIASGLGSSLTSGVATQFGAFNNSADMAIALGFKSFSRGGYTFHKHSWKLLNDPTQLGIVNGATELSPYAGVMIPLSTVVDAKTGDRNPSLEINYKASNGYSREMEHWLTGSVLGANNATADLTQFNYRSEVALVTRAANRHVVITK